MSVTTEKKQPTNQELAKDVIPVIAEDSQEVFFRITESNSGHYLMIGKGQFGRGHTVLMETSEPVQSRSDIIGLVSMIIFGVVSIGHSVEIGDLGKVIQTLAFSTSAPLHAPAEEAVLSR